MFPNDVNRSLAGINLHHLSSDDFDSHLLTILNKHAPLKTRFVRGNEQPFMTTELRKAHMKRTRLLKNFRNNRSAENELAYKRQRNYCTNLLRRTKTTYYGNLNPSQICDNKKFWNTVKPLLSDKCMVTDSITLTENNKLVSEDKEVANIFNNFFSTAVKGLNIDYYEHFSWDCVFSESEDPITRAIEKYSKHPSIVKIKGRHP